MKKIQSFLLLAFGFLLLALLPAHAQTTCLTNNLATGLISSSEQVEGFGNPGGNCAVDPSKIAFAPFKIPTYDDLKSLYYNQSKVSNKTVITGLPGSLSGETLYLANGNLDVNSSPGGGGSVIFFVNGTLNINSNYTNGSPNSGTVFVVKGNINIKDIVDRIDAVLISGGIIYTAGAGCNTTDVPSSQLLVNGSLISLNSANSIKFCRKLTDNAQPAEKIVWQPKYLVILRNLLSDTYQKWSEIQ